MEPNLRLVKDAKPEYVYIGAVDADVFGKPSIMFYRWGASDVEPQYVAEHIDFQGKGPGFRNGLVQLARIIDEEAHRGRVALFHPPESAGKEAARLQAQGKYAPSYRSLNGDELTALRALRGMPTLRIAA